MSDEWIDILNEDLTIQKPCLKSEAHKYGHLHASVHIWFYTTDGKLLIQKRASNKIAFPNLWDVSVAGHILSGENPIKSAIREIKEEIGLDALEKELLYIGSFKELFKHSNNFIDNEIHYIYLCKLNVSIKELAIQKEELSALKLILIDDLNRALKIKGFEKIYVPHQPNYYKFIFKEIKKSTS